MSCTCVMVFVMRTIIYLLLNIRGVSGIIKEKLKARTAGLAIQEEDSKV